MTSVATLELWSLLAVAASDGTRRNREEDALLQAARSGDPRAFDQLYHRHAAWVYGRIVRLVGPGPECEDLVQQVFLGLYRALPGFRGEAALSTFLYRITVNVANAHLRKRSRWRTDPLSPETLDALVAPEEGPEARLRCKQLLAQAFALLARLKPAKRIAFVLRVVEGLSLEEIGEIVDASAPAVGQRVKHAERELLAMVEKATQRGRSHAI